jgi:predicted dehydrogenase
MNHQPIRRYGVVGAGNQAHYRIPSLLDLASEGCEVVAISDLDQVRPRDVAAKFGVPGVYRTLTDMIAAENLDGVMILAPHAYHAELAIEAMLAGLDVFGEKPMAVTLADCRRMLAIAAEHGVTLAIGYQFTFWVDWALEQIRSGALGELLGGHSVWSRAAGIPAPPSFWNDPDASGITLDICGHVVSKLVLMFGEVRSVRATSSRAEGVRLYGGAFRAEDTINARLAFASGALVKLEDTWADGGPPGEELWDTIFGTKGQLDHPFPGPRKDVAALRPVLRRSGDEGGCEFGPEPLVYHDVVVAQARNWHLACQGREPLRFSAEDAYGVERVVHALRRSAALNGVWVDVLTIES